jgi:N-acetylneuraminic acid mutarotase
MTMGQTEVVGGRRIEVKRFLMKKMLMVFLLLVAGMLQLGISFRSSSKSLTFEVRVRCQEAIERVYYEHRIWPKENPGPKPPFESMISRTQIAGKVEDYLKKSSALDKFWRRPIKPEQLQAEMDRMAKQTQDPETLKEIFTALDNDPYLIAECLARPILSDRLILNWYAHDSRFHREAKEKAEKALRELTPENFTEYPEGKCGKIKYVLHTSSVEDPSGRFVEEDCRLRTIRVNEERFKNIQTRFMQSFHESILEDTEDAYIIERLVREEQEAIEIEDREFQKIDIGKWWDAQKARISAELPESSNVTAVFQLPAIAEKTNNTSQGQWVHSSLSDVPDGRFGHTAVWTGSEMIIWGGYWSTGWRYNPSTDSWMPTSTEENVPSGRSGHSAVWTGTEMIIWGGGDWGEGDSGAYFNTGGRYNPETDSWIPTSTGASVPAARSDHSAVWTGSEMIVWGGNDYDGSWHYLNTGGRYSPSSDSWASTAAGVDVPAGRNGHTAVWTGAELIVWGGSNDSPGMLNTGARYNPRTDSWIPTTTGMSVPVSRIWHTAVWTGTEMIVWGGRTGSYPAFSALNTGGRYNPLTDSWTPTSTGAHVPEAREFHTAVWTGSEMIVWGGIPEYEPIAFSTGGRYDPLTDSWIQTSTGADVPSGRAGHAAVWTGTEMIVWGGGDFYASFGSGGRYNPATDSWIPTFQGVGVPMARTGHTGVWTGAEMIIWGGSGGNSYFNTGGCYDPSTDSWSPTSTGANVPSARTGHTAVWTGTEMIVWGGNIPSAPGYTNIGGRYNPSTDSWLPTSAGANVPDARDRHSTVWTGTEMIVWGGESYDDVATYFYHFNTGGRYDPSMDSWVPTSTGADVPDARGLHTAVWTGTEMIIWGGIYVDNSRGIWGALCSGGRYSPAADSWTPISIEARTPSPRYDHIAVWTGTEMIIWGGGPYHYFLNDGGRYDPMTDAWVSTSTGADAPSGRNGHTAVWTGTEMIVWGGRDKYNYFATGGCYDPSTDSWISTAMGSDVPSARDGHTAIWTGTGMIVWGGSELSSGGIYRPYSSHTRPVDRP